MEYDIAIIGAGIVGLGTAMALSKNENLKIVVVEAEPELAKHQTGNNSGVIHSGLYYKPGSLKAKNCVEGRQKMYRFCEEHNIPHDRCGKIVVATADDEIPRLDNLYERGIANGLQGLKRLSGNEIHEYEPHTAGIAGLVVPETGIVDYVRVCEVMAGLIRQRGNEILLNSTFFDVEYNGGKLIIKTSLGEIQAANIINCAGLYSDRVARKCGIEPGVKIVPFRGEYYELKPDCHYLVNNLIYPVPDPSFPFLGVHFTRMIHGGVEAGPNAVLALKREGYTKTSFSFKDSFETLTYKGFLKLAGRFMRMGLGEYYRSFSKSAFVHALQKLIPEIGKNDIKPGGAGVRAQALDGRGNLVDDFYIKEDAHMIHVLNAPSPAATASISIGEKIAHMAINNFGYTN